ncbi:thiol-disulfide oxidoreductase DCC family protein [Actinophytocola sediminis]
MVGTLIFDGECGFCTRSRNLLVRLDRRGRLRTVPYQRAGVAEAAGVSRDDLARAVFWDGDPAAGGRCWGAEAINAALSAALGNSLLLRLYRLPGVRQAQDALYRWVAANRHRLPGTTPWCTSHPEVCQPPFGAGQDEGQARTR